MKTSNLTTTDSAQITELIQKIAGTYGKANVKLFDAEVVSIDIEKRICIVNSLDGSIEGITVRIMLDQSDGDMSVPEIESTVTVAMTDFTDPYLVKSTWLDEKLFVVGNQSYNIKKDKQIFNDGAYGGIPKIIDSEDSNAGLLKKLNNLEKLFNELQNKFNSWVVVPNDGGGALKTILTVTPPIWNFPQIAETTQKEIENENITHGKSF